MKQVLFALCALLWLASAANGDPIQDQYRAANDLYQTGRAVEDLQKASALVKDLALDTNDRDLKYDILILKARIKIFLLDADPVLGSVNISDRLVFSAGFNEILRIAQRIAPEYAESSYYLCDFRSPYGYCSDTIFEGTKTRDGKDGITYAEYGVYRKLADRALNEGREKQGLEFASKAMKYAGDNLEARMVFAWALIKNEEMTNRRGQNEAAQKSERFTPSAAAHNQACEILAKVQSDLTSAPAPSSIVRATEIRRYSSRATWITQQYCAPR